ncbi:restriction endonuclease subunit S [Vibrio parahaemolyticus]|uniref:restriction endonuclease subunit S n=1 Tax=Vibrio parahaemolyticus TaxID=670 RepID=UPI0004D633A5|nr:restriction endonuclease subunit S [Vibrio parahaemolyticus]EGQ9860868.1 restriction endonuclease subunit S [Vibrio parahaemolyticus]EGR5853519.1 restriction endonuclease subunit S [Vibrio parahaemolyticus]EJG1624627.1 restriction endonuclease subunit S [Vibrio parahaemolyticus]EJG1889032.1 restriction endonuclease subunit S [Vibrio parahaemolyticus]EKB7898551.1 restriction endonuclease subunit S [Vibrio parahaemolyticus]
MTEQQLPEGWQMVKFGDIAKHISKRVAPTETDLEVYVGLEHLDPDSLKIKRHGVPSDVAGQKLLVKKGQIIFGKRRAYQRKVAVADWDCICSAHAMVLEADTKNIIPEFLPFFMQSDAFMERAVAVSEGSLSPTIKWKVLAEQSFLMPSKEIQNGLLATFEAIEKNLTSTQVALESALTFKSMLTHKIFVENTFNYSMQYKKLSDICRFIGRGSAPKYSEDNTGYMAINQKCIRNGSVNTAEARYHQPIKALKASSILKEQDILINSTGTGTLGRAGLWVSPDKKTYFVDTHITRLELKAGVCMAGLLVEFFNTAYFQRQLYSECVSGSTNQIELNKTQLSDIRVPVISKEDLDQASELIEQINGNITALTHKEQQIYSLKKSMQKQYWS